MFGDKRGKKPKRYSKIKMIRIVVYLNSLRNRYGDPGIATILRASLVIGNFYDCCTLLAFDS